MFAPKELIKGNAAVLILSCLAREPMHGYRIVKELDKSSEGYFTMREGTIYPHLHQFEKDGLIEGYWENVSGERERKCYKITEKGKSELVKMCAQWKHFQSKVNKVLDLSINPGAV